MSDSSCNLQEYLACQKNSSGDYERCLIAKCVSL